MQKIKSDKKSAVPALIPTREKLPVPLDPLKQYMNEVGRYPLLGLEEEEALVNRYRTNGDMEAAKTLVTSNLRLVVKIVMEFKRAYANTLDLIQEGNLGLMRAVQKYDPEKGARFSYYASWWIRAYVIKYIIDNFRLVKLGTTHAQQKLFFNLTKEKNKMMTMGFDPTGKALADRFNVPEKTISEMDQRLSHSDLSLDAPVSASEGKSFLEFIADQTSSAEEKLSQRELKETLLEHLDTFVTSLKNDRERAIFEERLLSEIPTTLQEIADRYGITRERVRQLEGNIMKRLKGFFAEKGLRPEKG